MTRPGAVTIRILNSDDLRGVTHPDRLQGEKIA